MALLNRKLKEKPVEEVALLIQPEKVVLVDVEDDEDEEGEEESFTHHGITLWVSDTVISIIQHLQIFALILAMSERWGFPFDFIKRVYYVYLTNLDIWEFVKVQSLAYSGSTTSFVPSINMPFGYQPYFMAWTALFFVTCIAFLGTYVYFKMKRPLYLLLHVARTKRVFCVLAQIACLPVGIVISRVFHCREENSVMIWNVDNSLQCWTFPHYVYVAVACFMGFLIFIVYPVNLIRKTRGQVISFDPEKHEGYLQLKESEYNQGLDILWAVGQFHLFSSFKRMWIYYKPIMFYLKFFLLCFFSCLLLYGSSNFAHYKLLLNVCIASVFTVILFVMLSSSVSRPPLTRFRAFLLWLIWKSLKEVINIVFNVKLDVLLPKFFLVLVAFGMYTIETAGGGMGMLFSLLMITMLRSVPFRVPTFNFMIVFNFLINTANAYFGCVIEKNKASGAVSSLLVHPYPLYALICVNCLWLLVTIAWVGYLLMRYFHVICPKQPLWPTLSKDGKSDMGNETKKYMRAVLKGRHILEKALSSPPIFAPVHEIERQVHIINAYCREAEYLDNPTFESLWDLLDELIEAHRALAPLSLFSQSVKKSVRETAKEFMKLMPQMRKRLDQREYDFILMNPVKRRMLLKMYVLGAFVNGRCDKIRYEVEKKVHKSLEKAAKAPSSIISELVDWDSVYGTRDFYASNDTYGTISSSGSRPDTSLTSRVDSVDKLLDEVNEWEDEQNMMKEPPSRISFGSSLTSVAEQQRSPPEYSSSTTSLPGQVSFDEYPTNITPSRPKSAPSRDDEKGSKAYLATV